MTVIGVCPLNSSLSSDFLSLLVKLRPIFKAICASDDTIHGVWCVVYSDGGIYDIIITQLVVLYNCTLCVVYSDGVMLLVV